MRKTITSKQFNKNKERGGKANALEKVFSITVIYQISLTEVDTLVRDR